MDRTGAAPIGLALWGTEPVRTMADYAQLAEQVGFESIWLVDTQLLCRELYVTLAACAMATERLKLASGVTVPVTRHESCHGECAGNVARAVRRTSTGRHLHWSLGVAQHRRAACALLPTWRYVCLGSTAADGRRVVRLCVWLRGGVDMATGAGIGSVPYCGLGAAAYSGCCGHGRWGDSAAGGGT